MRADAVSAAAAEAQASWLQLARLQASSHAARQLALSALCSTTAAVRTGGSAHGRFLPGASAQEAAHEAAGANYVAALLQACRRTHGAMGRPQIKYIRTQRDWITARSCAHSVT